MIKNVTSPSGRILIPILIFIAALTGGCATTFERQNPVGEVFPGVRARVLTGDQVNIPEFFRDQHALFLIGYVQDSQFDIDRWLLALKQLKTPVIIAEIPTIQGFFPRMISRKIDQGMKDGIPEADWEIVFTVYKDAEKIASFLGNTKPRNARVALVNNEGVVLWFHDLGFSSDRAIELDKLVREKDSS